jgi:hypothetical protein
MTCSKALGTALGTLVLLAVQLGEKELVVFVVKNPCMVGGEQRTACVCVCVCVCVMPHCTQQVGSGKPCHLASVVQTLEKWREIHLENASLLTGSASFLWEPGWRALFLASLPCQVVAGGCFLLITV